MTLPIEKIKSGELSIFHPQILEACSRMSAPEYDSVRVKLKAEGITRLPELDKQVRRLQRAAEPDEPKVSDRLMTLSEEAEYFRESDGAAFTRIMGRFVPVKSKEFRQWLMVKYREATGDVVSDTVLRNVIDQIEAEASEAPKRRI